MFDLQCTVRNCCEILQKRDKVLACSAGHCFDQARQGYWSLVQPQDRKSKHPGDSDEAVEARRNWLERGHVQGLIDSVRPWTKLPSGRHDARSPRTLDLGCGEGTFGHALFAGEAAGFCGVDLSRKALKLASKRWPDATWILANADRFLPAANQSVNRVVSLFGRRPIQEIRRVLAKDGMVIFAVPGEDDLIELREHVQKAGVRRNRGESIIADMQTAGFTCAERLSWHQKVSLDPAAIADALAMTYRAVRHSQRSRLDSVPQTDVTMAADVMLFR